MAKNVQVSVCPPAGLFCTAANPTTNDITLVHVNPPSSQKHWHEYGSNWGAARMQTGSAERLDALAPWEERRSDARGLGDWAAHKADSPSAIKTA